jgi:hypothetical protein
VPGFISDSPLARGLIRIGDEAIAREDEAKLRDYFAEDYLTKLGVSPRQRPGQRATTNSLVADSLAAHGKPRKSPP